MRRPLQILLFISLFVFAGLLSSCNKGPKKFVAKDAEQGVVQIFAFGDKTGGTGSGFYIGDNLIITNHHVVDVPNIKFLAVGRKHGTDAIELQDATVQWKDKELDMAIIKVPDLACDELTLSTATIKKGGQAYAIGFPRSATIPEESLQELGALFKANKRGIIEDASKGLVQILDPTVSSGEIRKQTETTWYPNYSTKLTIIDHDVNIGHGNSGGPLFDACGRVIGINTQVFDDGADSSKRSSNITELIKVLESQNISANITSTPVEDILSNGMGWTSWLLLLLILGLVAYVLNALRKKPAAETIAQFASRVSGYTKLQRRVHKDQPTAPHHGPRWEEGKIVSGPPAQAGTPPPQTQSHSWILQSDSTSPHRVQVPISEELLQRYGYNLIIGRKQGVAHLVIDNSSISKSHAILSFRKGNFAIIDQKSANGTKINGTTLNPGQRTRINIGDKLTLGEVTVIFSQV